MSLNVLCVAPETQVMPATNESGVQMVCQRCRRTQRQFQQSEKPADGRKDDSLRWW